MAILRVANTHHDVSGFTRTQISTANTYTIFTGNSERIRISSAGNIGVGITNPTSLFHVNGTANIVSTLTVGGSVTAIDFNSVSDVSLKENIKAIENPQNILSQINPVSFQWKSDGSVSYGMIAQEVEKILPEIVNLNEDGTKSISYIQMIAFLIAAMKDLQKEVEMLKNADK